MLSALSKTLVSATAMELQFRTPVYFSGVAIKHKTIPTFSP
jgi:hypothetical protein